MKNKHLYFLVPLAISLLLFACNKNNDNEGPCPTPQKSIIQVNFSATVDGQVFTPGQEYTDVNGVISKVNLFKFYVSQLSLFAENGNAVEFKDADLVDFTSANTYQLNGTINPGDYENLRFGLGLAPEINSVNPADYAAGHPLSIANNTYWSWAAMYRFIMLEGQWKTHPDSALTSYLYHTGRDTLYRETTLTVAPFSIASGETKTIDLTVDINDIFFGNEFVDVTTEAFTHASPTNANEFDLARRVTENLMNAIE